MKAKRLLTIFLLIPFLTTVFFLWQIDRDSHLSEQREMTVRMKGFDPRDFLSGHCLLLQPDWDRTDCRFYGDCLSISKDFNQTYRYYLPQEAAQKLNEIVQKNQVQTEMVFLYAPKTAPVVVRLLLDGEPWKEWLFRHAEKERHD
jgi:hypothetical protein